MLVIAFPLVERHAAAHRDCLTGHVGIVEQHHDGLSDFLGLAEAAYRNPADEIRLALHHVRFDQGGGDCVDRDTFLDQACGVSARQAFNSGLRCIVVRPDRAGAPGGAR